ncbi:hypothetical protein [Bordetella sp. LUAb4]|uniref:hypothetical protein n=1 Tax=Bordetella sp. LUAb4 TaxID=2843195 RepID=UPI001E3929B9|nr:hypothetical protein [Bordetella sp. LUAb4]
MENAADAPDGDADLGKTRADAMLTLKVEQSCAEALSELVAILPHRAIQATPPA